MYYEDTGWTEIEDDGNTEIWYFTKGSALIASFTEPPKVFTIE